MDLVTSHLAPDVPMLQLVTTMPLQQSMTDLVTSHLAPDVPMLQLVTTTPQQQSMMDLVLLLQRCIMLIVMAMDSEILRTVHFFVI
jgi:hypothetical protein